MPCLTGIAIIIQPLDNTEKEKHMPEDTFNKKYVIASRYLSKPSKRRSGRLIAPGVKFIVAHDTGNPGSTACGNVAYYERSRDEVSASAHIFVDDKEIIECIPVFGGAPEKAWHVLYGVPTDNALYGYDANDAAIGIEYCYGENINADEAYRKYIWIMAYICHTFGLDPKTSVVGHFFLDPARKTDPVTGLAKSRRTYEQLLANIVEEFAACSQSGYSAPIPQIHSQKGSARTSVKLNIRKLPKITSDVIQVVPAGTVLQYIGWTANGDSVNGNSKWYQDVNGNFFWSGGAV